MCFDVCVSLLLKVYELTSFCYFIAYVCILPTNKENISFL